MFSSSLKAGSTAEIVSNGISAESRNSNREPGIANLKFEIEDLRLKLWN
jgi:hypothetical protein